MPIVLVQLDPCIEILDVYRAQIHRCKDVNVNEELAETEQAVTRGHEFL